MRGCERGLIARASLFYAEMAKYRNEGICTLTRRKTSDLEKLRTRVWATTVACAAGEHSPDRLERLINERLGFDDKDETGVWRRYLAGTAKAFLKRAVKPNSEGVKGAEKIYPNSSRWFYSPIWFLLEDREFLPSEILQCVKLLPQSMQGQLLLTGLETTTASFLLAEVSSHTLFQLSMRPSTWSLGSMACVMRRAELSGNPPLFRRAGIGIIWNLEQLIPTEPEPLRAVLTLLLNKVKKDLDERIYPASGPVIFPIEERDLQQFGQGVEHWREIDHAYAEGDFELASECTKRVYVEFPV